MAAPSPPLLQSPTSPPASTSSPTRKKPSAERLPPWFVPVRWSSSMAAPPQSKSHVTSRRHSTQPSSRTALPSPSSLSNTPASKSFSLAANYSSTPSLP